MGNTAVEPAVGAVHGILCIAVIAGIGSTFIKGHDDVSPYGALYLHHIFGSEVVIGAVDMGFEPHPFLLDLAVGRKRIDLISTAVGKDISVPVHEFMKSPRLLQDVGLRPQVQVVGISKNDVRIDLLLQFPLMHSFYGSCGAYRHEDRGLDNSVIGGNLPGPGTAAGIGG